MVLKSICFDCHCRHSIILSFYFIFSSLPFVLLLIYKAEFPKRDKYICKSYRAEKHISMTFCGDWGEEKWRKGDSKQMCSGESSLQQLHIKTMKRKLFERHIYLLHNIISYVYEYEPIWLQMPWSGILRFMTKERRIVVAKAPKQTVTRHWLINI